VSTSRTSLVNRREVRRVLEKSMRSSHVSKLNDGFKALGWPVARLAREAGTTRDTVIRMRDTGVVVRTVGLRIAMVIGTALLTGDFHTGKRGEQEVVCEKCLQWFLLKEREWHKCQK